MLMGSKKSNKKKLFYVLALIVFIAISAFAFQSDDSEPISSGDGFDVIIVLGTPATKDCKPTSIMKQRAGKGIELFKQGLAPKIIFTGGQAANECYEAEVMKEYAISLGVPDSCILPEPKAKNTYQNARYSVEIMNEHNMHSAAIVTSKFHCTRSKHIFSNYDIEYQMFPCEDPPLSFKSCYWKLREFAIKSYHFIMGYSPTFGL
ncbi:MAG: YdcF family protein [Muribaculaceae bacterium]|nr:YdcF family protein [Muribaculaceae bacterium]